MAQPNVLIVDDTPANLKLLSEILKEEGYKVRPSQSGPMALAAAEKNPPDVILLDINMPDMDGYEVCARLKADDRLAQIPVIFLSALSEIGDKIKAFESGGVDYITKPFEYREVVARVETHLGIMRLRAELEAKIDELRQAEELRDSLTYMVVHDLRSPLAAVMMSLQVLEMDVGALGEESAADVRNAMSGGRAMTAIVDALLDVSKMESGEMSLDKRPEDLVTIADEACRALAGLTDRLDFRFEADEGPVTSNCDAKLLTRVVENLVGNALKFTSAEGSVTVAVAQGTGGGRVEVRDTGMGIPEEYREKIFEKFGQVEARQNRERSSTGLGLTFCKLVVEAHEGTIGLESTLGEGSVFWFELPGPS